MLPFDPDAASLEPGTTLIEASAGTGKTYSITGLVIRLLLDRDVQIGEIVAVTFTEAATKELRERVRQRIAAAQADLQAGESRDPTLMRHLASGDVARGIFRLNRAMKSFDEAQIFTIHGFCQRCLGDYAFESGASFDARLSGDSTPFFEELAHDFWRIHFWSENRLLAALAIAWKESPARWASLLQRTARHPGLVILPPAIARSPAESIAEIEEVFAAVRAEWERHGPEIAQVLRTDPGLSRAKEAFHPARVAEILADLALCCEQFECSTPECIGALASVCSDAIAAGKKGAKPAPAHRFFDLCGDFCRAVSFLFNQLARGFLLFAEQEMPVRKARTNTITYDDLIIGLRDALRGEGGSRLAASIGGRYQAALIDEFQDTDPAQYEIFQTIFGTGRHCLFFIGDPKQAIYGFRGADIFTYREAAKAARDRTFTLTTNWRSEPKLLAAFNQLFQGTPRPFVFDWIAYHAVHTPERPSVVPLLEKGKAGAPLRFRILQGARDGKELNGDKATELVMAQMTVDLAELYARGTSLAGRPLRYRDVAVLVRSNREAAIVQEALAEGGIRSILRTEDNVFATAQAEEIERFLQGVLEPRRDSVFKRALITPLFGLDAQQLYELELDDTKRQEWLGKFLSLQAQWVDGCFIAMFRQLLLEHSARARLIKTAGGERRLTNYLQLAELLHETETARHLSPDALCAFLGEQRSKSWTMDEHYQMRLESGEDAVEIITVHKAKGLEYPIVFCPFLWKPAESQNRSELQFHDRDNGDRLTFDLREKKGGEGKHAEWQSEEVTSEELRLTYVALTRAMNRCYIYVPDAKNAGDSPLGRLLGADACNPLVGKLEQFIAASKGCAEAMNVTGASGPLKPRQLDLPPWLAPRAFAGSIPSVALTASFTGLNTGVQLVRQVASTVDDPPPQTARSNAREDTPSIFTFPRGAAAGDFFHDVLEHLDFSVPDAWGPAVADKMRLHGVGNETFSAAVCDTLRNIRDVELEPGMRLGQIPSVDLIRELEFIHTLKAIDPAALRGIFSRCPDLDGAVLDRIGRLNFRPVEGFMRGFIDGLVRWNGRFYLVDWKSNWLGPNGGDYGGTALHAAMLEHNYYLQYHLYTLAADLFLRMRVRDYDYDKHFGGIFYLFLRGVDAHNPAQGIFRARPAMATLTSLHGLLP